MAAAADSGSVPSDRAPVTSSDGAQTAATAAAATAAAGVPRAGTVGAGTSSGARRRSPAAPRRGLLAAVRPCDERASEPLTIVLPSGERVLHARGFVPRPTDKVAAEVFLPRSVKALLQLVLMSEALAPHGVQRQGPPFFVPGSQTEVSIILTLPNVGLVKALFLDTAAARVRVVISATRTVEVAHLAVGRKPVQFWRASAAAAAAADDDDAALMASLRRAQVQVLDAVDDDDGGGGAGGQCRSKTLAVLHSGPVPGAAELGSGGWRVVVRASGTTPAAAAAGDAPRFYSSPSW